MNIAFGFSFYKILILSIENIPHLVEDILV